MKKNFLFFYLLFALFPHIATANPSCSNLQEKLDSRTLTGPMYCSNIEKTDSNFNFASIESDASGKYRISLWNLDKSNKEPVYSSALFRIPFKECCIVEIKNNSVYLSGDSSSPDDVLDETYQMKFRRGIFQIIGYTGCESIFDDKHNDTHPKVKTCADVNLINGAYKRSIKKGKNKAASAEGKIKPDIFDTNHVDFFDTPQRVGADVLQP
ncbi:hypothetical protein [Paludibacterium purpuratum]|uniref:Uncharacterized protein n=1 Tax=Paludibacterium purpuratum TaxID=1144873 RepID=A0A4R7B7F8_9NEIS|nr:hypothetical protein [Paludibacterium purpuratum]TDR80638.1 hypothetical protein DFP86_104137 [Paludibacterium purpuratum]